MNTVDCGGQGTGLWIETRLGMLTGSRISAAITKAKRETTGELQARYDLRLELAVERVTKRPVAHYVSEWMERGTDLEPLARAAYELRTGATVQCVDFVRHPTIEMAGCSPDGLCGNAGIQIKVPKPTTHASYLIGECVPAEYRDQMMWEIAVCGWEHSEFISYCPDFPEPLDLFICRLPRDEKRIKEMEAEASKFLQDVESMVIRLAGGLEAVLRASLPVIQQPSVLPRAHIPTGEI